MNAVRYFRGLGPARRRKWKRLLLPFVLVGLSVATILAAVQQFA